MEQEKFAQKSSNTNMPRDTVETLKQIQKQGLSISIVKSGGGLSSTTTDSRSKPVVLPADKTAKITPVAPRPPTTTENKAQIIAARLTNVSDNRILPTTRAPTQSVFHDSKVTANQTRSVQPAVSESKGFTQTWSSSSSVDKPQSTQTRPVVTTASKIQPSQARVHVADNKTAVSRSNQSVQNENKNLVRVSSGQRVSQCQQLLEGKMPNNQDRVNTSQSSDGKGFSNQGRTMQQFIVSQDNKAIPVPKVVPQKVGDCKTTNQLTANKSNDTKLPQVSRITPNIKIIPDTNQNKARSNYPVKSDGKSNMTVTSPMIVENKMVNSVRLVTNVVDGNATRTTQCKSSSTQMRVLPNPTGIETATGTKILSVHTHTTKMVCFQSVHGQTENKVILQGSKVTAQTSSDMIQKTATLFDMSSEASHASPVSSRISATKRSATLVNTPMKKKCIKGMPPTSTEIVNKNTDGNSVNSPEDGEENEAQFFNNLKTSRTGLTITPVRSSIISMPSSSNTVAMVRMPGEPLDKELYQHQGNTWEKSTAVVKSPRGKSRSRGRRRFEPVCLTISSDEEEEHMQVPFHNFEEALSHQIFPHESEGSKSGQSSPAYPDEDNPESDDPQFPGVTDINQKTHEEPYEDEEEEDEEDENEEDEEEIEKDIDDMEIEEEESMCEDQEGIPESDMDEEEVPPEEDDEPNHIQNSLTNTSTMESPLQCRSVRIGSYKIHPTPPQKTLNVYLALNGISFNSPMVSDSSKRVPITIKPLDITHMVVHFGKCLPIIFIFTTPNFAESVRKSLNMFKSDLGFYDPNSSDDRLKKITFLIDTVKEEHRRFFRHCFINEKKIQEVDQKTANEILVKSTPSTSNSQIIRCEAVPQLQSQPQQHPSQPLQFSQENVITLTPIQNSVTVKLISPQPVTRLFTYPPPPQTGGIPITNEDLACLNEGEFLNDAIIDFYLKYVFYEKLSDYNRDKTHVFSSYFYHRLTHKPERARSREDVQKNMQTRRHNQVKTWTRHVDIFSKDFIIIPVNQNVHWFLAIICYPGLVPEAPESPVKSESRTNNKSSDNVTSTDDQEENKASKEPNSTIDGNNQISDENSTTSSNSMFENEEEPDSEEPMPEAPDSSTHPDKNRRRKEVPCICIFDSLNGPNRSRIATMLREYLEVEWRIRKGTRKVFDKSTMQGYIMQCPQQTNYSDCGIYVLQYVESFFENPLPYFDSPIPNLSNWFPKEKVAKKRQELKDLIISLQKKYPATATTTTTTSTTNRVSETVPASQTQVLQNDNR